MKKALPIFTVLTISATGSEMNNGGVITNEEQNKKWSFSSPFTFPKVSIIDPAIQATLSKEQTVYGAIDGISHVFEYYFEGTGNTDIIDEISEGIIRNIMKHVQILIEEPDNYDSRAELAWSCTLALNKTLACGKKGGDWSSHIIEHSLSVFTDIAHGAGLAIIFPAWIKYLYKNDMDKFERFAEKIFNITEGEPEVKIEKAVEELKAFYRRIGAPVSLREIGVKEDELEKLADNASLTLPMGRLKKLSREDILNILKIAYD